MCRVYWILSVTTAGWVCHVYWILSVTTAGWVCVVFTGYCRWRQRTGYVSCLLDIVSDDSGLGMSCVLDIVGDDTLSGLGMCRVYWILSVATADWRVGYVSCLLDIVGDDSELGMCRVYWILSVTPASWVCVVSTGFCR
ncbi:hypothetical protein BaRGS_00039922 [Batillaria attramentaria]|uniref:Uncharacterized protein n=1 Tax=Batillaria attramentaria TaxID=370345 RepID=A0ABD0J213_9CAEN